MNSARYLTKVSEDRLALSKVHVPPDIRCSCHNSLMCFGTTTSWPLPSGQRKVRWIKISMIETSLPCASLITYTPFSFLSASFWFFFHNLPSSRQNRSASFINSCMSSLHASFLAFQQLVNPNKRQRASGITFSDSFPKFSSDGPSPAGQTATAPVTNTSDRPRPRSNQVFGRLQH